MVAMSRRKATHFQTLRKPTHAYLALSGSPQARYGRTMSRAGVPRLRSLRRILRHRHTGSTFIQQAE
ncbi:hypothetical protein BD310DRAFT_922896 [Dichomitus squalens]|uniref:Uncharacterized protein n=1 Tax=Dichomitus squalens TaxID=114155 RepID=A0A4Q9PZX4_9APHY|nr:hypothetical protein BD310DRAFT_922896 [Dichomitus squalens]